MRNKSNSAQARSFGSGSKKDAGRKAFRGRRSKSGWADLAADGSWQETNRRAQGAVAERLGPPAFCGTTSIPGCFTSAVGSYLRFGAVAARKRYDVFNAAQCSRDQLKPQGSLGSC